MDKGVSVYMVMGKLKHIEKILDEMNGKIDDLQGAIAQLRVPITKGLERPK